MDLSRMLGDLYDGDEEQSAAPRPPATGPEWSDEARLDEVFASWTPGPPEDAPSAEREMGRGGAGPATDEHPLQADSTQPQPARPRPEEMTPEEPWGSIEPGPDSAAAMPAPAGEARRWTRSDDDVLPRRGARVGLRLNLLRR